MTWSTTLAGIDRRTFKCGYCRTSVNSANVLASQKGEFIYICPKCDKPTYFGEGGVQIPGIAPGDDIADLPEDIEHLYSEARSCVAAKAYTAAVLTCRKLLMNIAVAKKAPIGQSFVEYVNYLNREHYIPPDSRGWVDHIRSKGNEANHEIVLMTKEDAERLISLSDMLLKIIYEFPAKVPRTQGAPGDE